MSIIRVGTTKKYADGWDAAFGGGKKKSAAKPTKKTAKKSTKPAKAAAKSAKAKPAKKKAGKKR